jgi:hypothetical protein
MADELIKLDFVEHDSIAALKYLITVFEENRASGMVFALTMKHKTKTKHLTGVTGRLAGNVFEAAGLAAVLHLQMVRIATDN